MTSKTIQDPELGEIELRKYKRAKYLRIKINERGKVAISLPYFSRYDEGLAFLEEKRFWVRTQLEVVKARKQSIQDFKTKFRELELIPCDVSKATYRLSPTKIKVYYPAVIATASQRRGGKQSSNNEQLNLNWIASSQAPCNDIHQHPQIEPIIRAGLEAALRREAHNYLPRRLRELANHHGLNFKGISIRNTRTRWGSCSHGNNISLCMHLMKLPDELIDYVLLHELAHTVEKNHSRRFWDLLSSMLGADAKAIDKRLKRYQPEI
ncbi:MAG: SprT family zinc-dependent metalloprotease [Candidatus Melainabacteria bacterium]|nr:SprT family zinc-dependent metalloprotease [Candidatus Melainabacteria bacterium]